jgi:hypothetical protein
MKKVKIMLMSLLVIGSVAGALAFKAKTYSLGLKCGTAENSCSIVQNVDKYTFTDGAAIDNFFCTTAGGATTHDCQIVTTEQ